MAGSYYIRSRGRRLGPLTVDQLQAMARRGRFGRHYEVSSDGRQWCRAGEIAELFDDGGGNQMPDDDGDGCDEPAEIDPYAPLIDEPATGRNKRRPARRSRDDPAPLPPIDPIIPEADPPASGRQRRTFGRSRRSGGTRGDEDDNATPWMDETGPGDNGADAVPVRRERFQRRRPGMRERTPPAPVSPPQPQPAAPKSKRDSDPPIDNDDPSHNTTDDNASAKKGKKKKKSKPQKKPSGGLLSFFFSGKSEESEYAGTPHLETLYERSRSLRQMDFEIEDITLVGAGHQKLPVVGHSDGNDAIRTLGLLIMIAYQTRASDIHFEPKEDFVDARVRVDGILVPVVRMPKPVASKVFGVIKVLCEIDFSGQQSIQEGSFSCRTPDRRTDFRISFTPSVHGQKLAVRVLDLGSIPQSVTQLGAPKPIVSKLQSVMKHNAGMVLLCGPTGSGKTTTLYSLIRSVNVRERNVMTLEDPVEYQIEGVTQSSIRDKHGKSFADMLRALLRQDPDVLLLGEIRDAESAKIAMQATMTGHLVLSTVHAQDTLNTVFRLLDLGADPNMVASSLDLVLAQRLVRVLCRKCRKRRRPNETELRRMGSHARDIVYEPSGCQYCLKTGFSGRRPIFELLATNDALREVVLKSPTLQQLRQCVAGTGFHTLRQHGYQLVAEGVTSATEIDRVIGDE